MIYNFKQAKKSTKILTAIYKFISAIFAYIKKKQYLCRRKRRSMTSLLCNLYNCRVSSSPQKLKFSGTPIKRNDAI